MVTRFTSASVIFLGEPGRGSSINPTRRLSGNWRRHLPALWLQSPTPALTLLLESTWARASNNRARCARAFQIFAGCLSLQGISFGRAESGKWQRSTSPQEHLLLRVQTQASDCMKYL